jgi:hypothetical protein
VSLNQRFVAKINSGRIYSPVPKAKAEIAVVLYPSVFLLFLTKILLYKTFVLLLSGFRTIINIIMFIYSFDDLSDNLSIL